MTDTTDIEALTRPVRDRYDWPNAVWRDCDQCGKQHTGTVTAEDGSQICAHCADQLYWSAWQVLAERAIDQLEAERQRADDAVALNKHLDLSIRQGEGVNAKLRRSVEAAEEECAELRSKLANPVVLPKSHYVCGCADKFMSAPEVIEAIRAAGFMVKGETE